MKRLIYGRIGGIFESGIKVSSRGTHDVGERSGNPKVLLLQTKNFSSKHVILGVQDSSDVFGLFGFLDGFFVVSG